MPLCNAKAYGTSAYCTQGIYRRKARKVRRFMARGTVCNVAMYNMYHVCRGYSAHTATPIAAINTHVVDTPSRLPEPFLGLPRLMPSGKP